MFRDMLPSGTRIVRETNPRVILRLDPTLDHDRGEDRLDFDERDDQLVGTLQNFAKTNPGEDARLLTHDTGPLYTAHSLGLKVEKIPDSWLLRPENDEHQKKIHILESELRRLKRSEPSFEVRFIDATGNETERFDGQMRWFEALSDRQVHELVDQLRQRFAMAATPRATTESPGLELAALTNLSASLFGHPDPEEVAKYREQDYPQWLDTCQDILANFHYLLQWEVPALRFAFAVRNSGIRPAEDALVTLTVKGSLRIMPPRESVEPVPLRLPGPPKPPQGNLHRLANLHDRSALAAFRTPDLHFDGPPLLRDRNKFYARGQPPHCTDRLLQSDLRSMASQRHGGAVHRRDPSLTT